MMNIAVRIIDRIFVVKCIYLQLTVYVLSFKFNNRIAPEFILYVK